MSRPKTRRPVPRFDRLRLRNIRCFRDTTIPLDPRITVILGANGSGKTTLVESLASLTHGEDEGLSDFPLRRKTQSGAVYLFEEGAARPAARWSRKGRTTSVRRLPRERYLFAYGRYRRVLMAGDEEELRRWEPAYVLSELASRAGDRRTLTLTRPDNNLLRDLSRYLVALDAGRRGDPRLERIWTRLNASLCNLGPGLTEIRMRQTRRGPVPMVVRDGLELELRELSDGYQAFLVIVFDLMLRYAYLFPELDDPLEGRSLVAIDEVDLHLHPRWQRTVTRQLLDLFPGTQFVVTTHSPSIVQSAIDEGRAVVALRESGGAVEADALAPGLLGRLKGAEIGSVLFDESLFDLPSRYSPVYGAIEREVEDLTGRTATGAASKEDRRKLRRHLDILQGLLAKDEKRRAGSTYVSQLADLRTGLIKDLMRELETTGGTPKGRS